MLSKKHTYTRSRNLKGEIRNLGPAQFLESKVMPARINRIISTRSANGMSETQLSSVKVNKAGYSPI